MDFALAFAVLVIGGVGGSLMTYAFLSDRPIIDQFNEIQQAPDSVETRARSGQ